MSIHFQETGQVNEDGMPITEEVFVDESLPNQKLILLAMSAEITQATMEKLTGEPGHDIERLWGHHAH